MSAAPTLLPVNTDPIRIAAAPTEYGAWASVAVVALLAFGIVAGGLLAVRLVTRVLDRIRSPAERLSTYECGEEPVGSAWFRFNNRFTTVALTFLVFEVELALLWPILPRCVGWMQQGSGTRAFVEVLAFAGTLAVGLMWVAATGAFVWDRLSTDAPTEVDRV